MLPSSASFNLIKSLNVFMIMENILEVEFGNIYIFIHEDIYVYTHTEFLIHFEICLL